MPDDQWRAEIHETALLLEAVASGDRSRVVKHLTDYLLGRETNQDPSEPHQEEQVNYYGQNEEGYEGDQGYGDTYQEGGDQYGHGDHEYQYGDGYNEYSHEGYDPSGADDSYYEEPYMSGAYNGPGDENDTYSKDAYEEGYNDKSNYDQTAYGNDTYGLKDTADAEGYARANHDSFGTGNDSNLYSGSQRYQRQYDDQGENSHIGEVYDDWNGEVGNYQHPENVNYYGGGELPQRSEYGLVSDDRLQVVSDDANQYEAVQLYPEEGNSYGQNETYGAEDSVHTGPEANPEESQEYPGQAQQDPEEDTFPYETTREAPPEYSAIPNNENTSIEDDGVGLQEGFGSGEFGEERERRDEDHKSTLGLPRDEKDNTTDDGWEDERCREEDERVLSPISPGHSDLQYNPLGRQYSMPTVEWSKSRAI